MDSFFFVIKSTNHRYKGKGVYTAGDREAFIHRMRELELPLYRTARAMVK
ncbi:hypothetical protein [Desmospora profundinema]|uniref:Uncharacterized protein n=1 Tax=Desmospora profundinema TaxID=1571184 RepID=A0ABU1IKN0_9BACL|nr:hypothetical protein [Desmospora profundinema]MDR6225331.1 hypothetical protein [Desmospora profundinema]